jgi:hypothetical protein
VELSRYVVTVVAIIALLVAVFFAVRESVLRGFGPAMLRVFLQEFFPPRGMYDKRYFSEIDLRTDGVEAKLTYSHSYFGDYELGFGSSKRLPNPLPRGDLNAEISVRVGLRGKVLRSWRVATFLTPWWDQNSSGFALVRYNVPRDLPRSEPLEFSVVIDRGSSFFEKNYGTATIYIGKASEK